MWTAWNFDIPDSIKMVRNKHNTPGIIKYPFWQMTAENPNATYICINYEEAICPQEIKKQAICIDGDIGTVLKQYFICVVQKNV